MHLSGVVVVHTRLIDSTINDALRIVNECLRPTPTDSLPVLAGIQLAGLCRKEQLQHLPVVPLSPGTCYIPN